MMIALFKNRLVLKCAGIADPNMLRICILYGIDWSPEKSLDQWYY